MPYLCQIAISPRVFCQMKPCKFVSWHPSKKPIENVVVPFAWELNIRQKCSYTFHYSTFLLNATCNLNNFSLILSLLLSLSPVAGNLIDNTRLFQQVLFNFCSLNVTICIKMNINVLSKSAGVVVPTSSGISKCLKVKHKIKC